MVWKVERDRVAKDLARMKRQKDDEDVDWIEANRDCARLAKISVTEDGAGGGERKREGEKGEGGSGTSRRKGKKASSRQELPVSLEHTTLKRYSASSGSPSFHLALRSSTN